MEGGTEFRFVNQPIEAVLADAFDAAGGKDVRVGGGVSTMRQYVQARLIDEMHLVISPTLLGSGEHLLTGLDLPKLGYEIAEHVRTDAATHVVVKKRG
jgi:dihydrofolate reductase